ncbi:MAG TPA: bifunctional precorrin-2 dehydrogenase/sirohydrochlorin ferrochelatase [Acidimicrobiales bacterium]|nr:bifunctional precorrin-2 dehydrogenase/sirohydrochlorin ferrochelatase [Acidimicrobiales bacterium]
MVDPTELVYPVALRLAGKPVLVVGGGSVADRKVTGLLAAGAFVTVVAPDVSPALYGRGCAIERREYQAGEASGYRLVITATDDPAVNRAVHDDAEAAGVWVNAADQADLCTFFLPAVAQDGPVIVAVSTSGTSPALAGWLRDRVAAVLPAGVGEIAETLATERAKLRAEGTSTETTEWTARIEELLGEAAPAPKSAGTTKRGKSRRS